jgi:hypothetical protein
LSSYFKNYISKVVVILSDTPLETISECSHDSFRHFRGKSGDFAANSVLESLNEMDVADAWFQQDGATTHMARRSMQVLREMFRGS